MATSGFKYHSGPVRIIEATEANSQSFTPGDLVYLVSGAVTIAANDTSIMGVALKAGTNVTTGNITIPVQVLTPDTLFVAEVDTTSATTQVGEDYGLNVATAGSMSIDIADTTTTSVRVERLDSRDGAKATGRVIVRFDPAVFQNIH